MLGKRSEIGVLHIAKPLRLSFKRGGALLLRHELPFVQELADAWIKFSNACARPPRNFFDSMRSAHDDT